MAGLGQAAGAGTLSNAAVDYIKALAAEADSLLPALVPRRHRSLARIDRRREPGGTTTWCLRDDGRTVVTRPHLSQVMCWLNDQGFSNASLAPHCAAQPAVRQLHDALLAAERLLVINAEVDHVTPWDVAGDALITPSDDPMSYSAQRFCLVQSCELIEPGARGPSVFTGDVTDVLARATDVPGLKVACIGDIRRGRIQARVASLIDAARDTLAEARAGFAFQLGRDLCVLARSHAEAPTRAQRTRNVWEAVHVLPTLTRVRWASDTHLDGAFATLLAGQNLAGPSLWLTPGERDMRVLYRAAGVRALWRFPTHGDAFAETALRHFLARATESGGETVPVFELARHGAVRQAAAPAFDTHHPRSVTLHREADGWRMTAGVDTWFRSRLTRRTLRYLVRTSNAPLHVSELSVPGADLPLLLNARLRLEAVLARLQAAG